MKSITLRVLDGANRGEVYEGITVPVTIGREEGNTIQLNDERISRFHLKIQQDHEDLVLTDLQSTNGSRVNNEEVQLKILRKGDLISIGRSTLVYGTRELIKERIDISSTPSDHGSSDKLAGLAESLLSEDPPGLPKRLSPGQAAQLAEVIEYLHLHLRQIIQDAEMSQRGQAVHLSQVKWQQIVDLQSRLAEYTNKIGKPAS
jgi:pSer/pThr/pTyr-binding forkhead associated (FHA) protein